MSSKRQMPTVEEAVIWKGTDLHFWWELFWSELEGIMFIETSQKEFITVVAESHDRNLTGRNMADNLEPSTFPMQKGSLNLLRQKWESNDYQKSECCLGSSRCKPFQPRESKLLEPEGGVALAREPSDPATPGSLREEMLSSEPGERSPENKSDNSREQRQSEILKEDSLSGRRRIERFSIALDELRSVFEDPRSGNRLSGPTEHGRKVRNYILRVEVFS
ncbi:uncharacterized protein LOC132534362 [Erinaceus europaeus]|uniref:Uncharacterized protein LOC132534362 n=1 Tax=Erinaceus europaeus TaxID=9365 RepID=A0ABM3WCH8_ERIEU|nr:uncharacterized protein LOC132534362 [Erinaceus europaeus]